MYPDASDTRTAAAAAVAAAATEGGALEVKVIDGAARAVVAPHSQSQSDQPESNHTVIDVAELTHLQQLQKQQ